MKFPPSMQATLNLLCDELTYDTRSGPHFHGFIGECALEDDGLLYRRSAAMPQGGVNSELLRLSVRPDDVVKLTGYDCAGVAFDHTQQGSVRVLEILRFSRAEGGIRSVGGLVSEVIDPLEKWPEWAFYCDFGSALWFKRPCTALDGRRPMDLIRGTSDDQGRLQRLLDQGTLRSVL